MKSKKTTTMTQTKYYYQKTIMISEQLHSKLMQLKYKHKHKTVEQVITQLLQTATKNEGSGQNT